ncbi:MAG: hypothetical protein J5547_04195 [Clostridia bacterium]|nr:hypothetical protein [Clostridia bacterium]
MAELKLHSFSFKPGYCDMLGPYHGERIEKNENGEWRFISRDREHHGAPEIIAVYAVSAEAVKEFETFLKQRKIRSLEKRSDSKDFITDYSPWSYSYAFRDPEDPRYDREYHRIEQYKKYSKKDYALLQKLRETFESLRGEKLYEAEERDTV